MQRDTRPPTKAQIETVYELIRETRGDVDWYAPERMTRGQVARLIEKLQDEKGRADDGRITLLSVLRRESHSYSRK